MVVLQQSTESFERANGFDSSALFPYMRRQSFLAFSSEEGIPPGEKYQGG